MTRRVAAVLAAVGLALPMARALHAGQAGPGRKAAPAKPPAAADKAAAEKPPQPIHVWADRIRYLQHKNLALINGTVTVIKGDLRIDCDDVEATLDPETRRFTRITATGNVRIATVVPIARRTTPRPPLKLAPNPKRAACAKAEYDPESEMVVLTGTARTRPVAYVGSDAVRADLITYDRRKNLVLFEGNVWLQAIVPERSATPSLLPPSRPAPKQ